MIQYRFSTLEKSGPRQWIFFGRVLSAEEILPAFVQRPNAFFVPGIQLIVPVFPFDPKLKILPKFFQSESSSTILGGLSQIQNLNGTARITRVEILGYRLERRSLLSLVIQEKNRIISIVAKLVRPEKAAGIFTALRELENTGFNQQTDDQIGVPHPIAHSLEGIVWLEKIDEPSLHDLTGTDAFVSACQAAGRTLNKLHRAVLKNLSLYSVEEEWKRLKEMILETAQIYPELADQLTNTFSLLNRDVPVLRKEEMTPVHRDFYDKQLLVGPKRVTLIDTDTLALGDPALDVGNFLAHLVLRAGQHPEAKQTMRDAHRLFTEEYRVATNWADAETFWKRVGWWETATLLRLACLYSLRPRWKELAPFLLEEAQKRISAPGKKNA